MPGPAKLTVTDGEPLIGERIRLARLRNAEAEAILRSLKPAPLFDAADLAALAAPRRAASPSAPHSSQEIATP